MASLNYSNYSNYSQSNLDWDPEASRASLGEYVDSIALQERSQNDWLEKQESMRIKRAETATKRAQAALKAKQEQEEFERQKSEHEARQKAEEEFHWTRLVEEDERPPWHRETANHVAKPKWLLELLVAAANKEDQADDDIYAVYRQPALLNAIKEAAQEEQNSPNHKFKCPKALPLKAEAQAVKDAPKVLAEHKIFKIPKSLPPKKEAAIIRLQFDANQSMSQLNAPQEPPTPVQEEFYEVIEEEFIEILEPENVKKSQTEHEEFIEKEFVEATTADEDEYEVEAINYIDELLSDEEISIAESLEDEEIIEIDELSVVEHEVEEVGLYVCDSVEERLLRPDEDERNARLAVEERQEQFKAESSFLANEERRVEDEKQQEEAQVTRIEEEKSTAKETAERGKTENFECVRLGEVAKRRQQLKAMDRAERQETCVIETTKTREKLEHERLSMEAAKKGKIEQELLAAGAVEEQRLEKECMAAEANEADQFAREFSEPERLKRKSLSERERKPFAEVATKKREADEAEKQKHLLLERLDSAAAEEKEPKNETHDSMPSNDSFGEPSFNDSVQAKMDRFLRLQEEIQQIEKALAKSTEVDEKGGKLATSMRQENLALKAPKIKDTEDRKKPYKALCTIFKSTSAIAPEGHLASSVHYNVEAKTGIVKPAFVLAKEQLKSSQPCEKLELEPAMPRPSFAVTARELQTSVVKDKLDHKPALRKPSFVVTTNELKTNIVTGRLEHRPALRKPAFAVSVKELESSAVKDKLSAKPKLSALHAPAKEADFTSMKNKHKHREELCLNGAFALVSSVNGALQNPGKPAWAQRDLILRQSSRKILDGEIGPDGKVLASPLDVSKVREATEDPTEAESDEEEDSNYTLPWKESRPKPRISVEDLKSSHVQEILQRKQPLQKPFFSVSPNELMANEVNQKLKLKPDLRGKKAVATSADMLKTRKNLKHFCTSGPSDLISSANLDDSTGRSRPAWMLRTMELQQSLRSLNCNETKQEKVPYEAPWKNVKLKSNAK